jgi:hypothetical protein
MRPYGLVILLALVLTACAEWSESWPIPVHMKGGTSTDQQALAHALTEWNALLPVDAFELAPAPDSHFYVEVRAVRGDIAGDPELAGRTGNFRKRRAHWAEIEFRTDLPADIVQPMFAHELGHVLLGTSYHSPDPKDIMFERYTEGAHVSEQDAQAVIDAHDLE